jgi:hypothetical protein
LIHCLRTQGSGFVSHVRLLEEDGLDPKTFRVLMDVEKMFFVGHADDDEVIDFGRVSATRKGFAAFEGCVRGLHDLCGGGYVLPDEQVVPSDLQFGSHGFLLQ